MALVFANGNAHHVNCGSGSSLDALDSGTILALIRPTALTTDHGVACKYDGASGTAWFNFYYRSTGIIRLDYRDGPQDILVASTTGWVVANTWQWIAATWNQAGAAADQKAYHCALGSRLAEVSGYNAQSIAPGTWGDVDAFDLYLGNFANVTWGTMTGGLEHVAIWKNRILTPDEMWVYQRSRLRSASQSLLMHLGRAGATVFDDSGYGNHGVVTGATWEPGPNLLLQMPVSKSKARRYFVPPAPTATRGAARRQPEERLRTLPSTQFAATFRDTANDLINCGSGPALENLIRFSLLGWIKRTTTATPNKCIAAHSAWGTAGHLEYMLNGTHRFDVYMERGVGTPLEVYSSSLTTVLNEWTFVACSMDLNGANSDQHLYIGTRETPPAEPTYGTQLVGTGAPNNAAGNFGFGNVIDSPQDWFRFVGDIGPFAMFNRNLTLAEIVAQWRRLHWTPDNVGLWALGQASNGLVYDYSGYGNHGLVTGAASVLGPDLLLRIPQPAQRYYTVTTIGGDVSVNLLGGGVSVLGQALTVIPGAASIPLDASALSLAGQALTVVANTTINLHPA